MSKEKPILFNGAMVRAILSGAKTQTRRVVKSIPWRDRCNPNFSQAQAFRYAGEFRIAGSEEMSTGFRCPFGQPGDRLWMRETWQQVHPIQIADDRYSQRGKAGIPGPPPVNYRTIYRADGEYPAIYSLGGEPWPYRSLEPFERNGMQAFVDEPRWTPSVHMPRWACRLVLEITDVRVERLQAISAEDALAEGAMEWAREQKTPIRDLDAGDERIAFKALWSGTGPGGDWDSNPWVWVIKFKRVEVLGG